MPSHQSKPKFVRKRWLAVLIIFVVAAFVIWSLLNRVAGQRLTRRLIDATAADVAVGSTTLRHDQVVAQDVVIGDPASPFFVADRMVVESPLSELVRRDPAIRSIQFDGAQLVLQLNADGTLNLPGNPSDVPDFPAEEIRLTDASVAIKQPGRTDLVLTGTELVLTKNGDGFRLKGSINAALGAAWDISGSFVDQTMNLDASTSSWEFSTQELAKLPLVPPGTDIVDASGAAEVTLRLNNNPASGPSANVYLRNANLNIASPELYLNEIAADIDVGADTVNARFLSAELGTGSVSGQASVNFRLPSKPGEFRLAFSQVPLSQVRSLTAIPKTVSGFATGELSGTFRFPSPGMNVSLTANGTIDNGKFAGIEAGPVDAVANVEELKLRPGQAPEVQGSLELRQLRAKTIGLQELVTALPDSEAWLAAMTIDNLTAIGELSIPLETAFAPVSWTANGTVEATAVRLWGKQLDDLSSDVTLIDGQLRLKDARARLDDGELVASVTVPSLVGEQPARVELHGTAIPAQTLIAWLLDSEVEVPQEVEILKDTVGEIAFNSVFDVPLATAADVSSWSGGFESTSARLSLRGTNLTDFKLAAQLGERVLTLTDFQLRAGRDGTIQGGATIPILPNSQIAVALDGRNIPAIDLARVASAVNPSLSRWLGMDRAETGTPLPSGRFDLQARLTLQRSEDLVVPSSGFLRANASDLSMRAMAFSRLQLDAEFAGGKIDRANLDLGLMAGGAVHAELVSPVDLLHQEESVLGRVRWSEIPLADASGGFGFETNWDLQTSGLLEVQVPLDGLRDRSAYAAKGSLRVDAPLLATLDSKTIRADVELADSTLVLTAVQMQFDQTPIQANGTVRLDTPFPYEFQLSTANVDLSKVLLRARFYDPPTGRFSAAATASGTLGEPRLTLEGHIHATNLRSGDRELPNLHLQLANDEQDRIQLKGTLFGGQLDVRTALPTPDANRLEIQLADLDLADVNAVLPARKELSLAGRLSGELVIADWFQSESRIGHVALRGVNAQYRGIEFDELNGEVRVNQDHATYRLTGNTLGGQIEVAGQATLIDWSVPTRLPFRLRLDGINLEDAVKRGRYAGIRHLAGAAEIDLDLTLDTSSLELEGTGNISLRDVQWKRKRFASLARAKLEVQASRVKLHDIRAAIGNGIVSGTLELPLGEGQSGTYELVARQVDIDPIAMLIWPKRRFHRLAGRVSVRASGRVGRDIRGKAVVEMANVSWQRAKASHLRVPIAYVVRPASSGDWSGRIKAERASARIKGGRIVTNATFDFGRTTNLDVDAKLAKVSMSQLIEGRSGFGQGNLSGSLKLAARSMRSYRDLRGNFRGKLEDSQSLQFPVLSDLTRFANLGQASQTAFDSGEINLRLANGIVSTQGIILQSDRAELFLQGNVSLNQKLDMNVAVQTGNFTPGFGIAGLTDSSLTRFALPGAGHVIQALEYLSNRVVYLHIGGTLRSPHYQLRTDKLIQDALIQFYLPNVNLQQLRLQQ